MTQLVRAACAALAVQCAFVPVLAAQQVSAFANTPVAPVALAPATGKLGEPTPAPRVGPTVEAARAGVAATPVEPRDAKAAAADAQGSLGKGQNVALMTVGGIALLTGLIIGGDGGTLIAVSGAVVGLYGLYNYIK